LSQIKGALTYFFILFCTLASAQKNLLPDTTGVCIGDSAILTLPSSLDKKVKIMWITPRNIEYNTKRVNAGKFPGKYIVQITDGGKIIKDSTVVVYVNRPKLNLRDTTVCRGVTLVMDVKIPTYKYLWNTNETTQRIRIDNSGKYWVNVSNKGCSYTDTFRVVIAPGIQTSFQNEVTYCLSEEQKPLKVTVPAGTKILWNTGSTANGINATKEGWYWVKTENKICGTRYDSVNVKLKACDCEMLIPNSFTPNDDNKNDYFFPILQCEYSYFSFTVFDKWGNQIYTTNSTNGKWDGRFKGNFCDEDIYVYKIESTEKGTDKKVNRSGRVSLIR
jgi:gliding motility-associated-like protein